MRFFFGIIKISLGSLMFIGIIASTISRMPQTELASDYTGMFLALSTTLLYAYSLINNGTVELKKLKARSNFFRISEIVMHFIYSSVFIAIALININKTSGTIGLLLVVSFLLFLAIREIVNLKRKKANKTESYA
jgi:hypothetical protein